MSCHAWTHENHLPLWKLDPVGPFKGGDDIADNTGLYIICIFAEDACSARPVSEALKQSRWLGYCPNVMIIFSMSVLEQAELRPKQALECIM